MTNQPQTQIPAFLADTVQSVSVHNGVARIILGRLDAQGNPTPVLELLIPITQAHHLTRAASSVTPALNPALRAVP